MDTVSPEEKVYEKHELIYNYDSQDVSRDSRPTNDRVDLTQLKCKVHNRLIQAISLEKKGLDRLLCIECLKECMQRFILLEDCFSSEAINQKEQQLKFLRMNKLDPVLQQRFALLEEIINKTFMEITTMVNKFKESIASGFDPKFKVSIFDELNNLAQTLIQNINHTEAEKLESEEFWQRHLFQYQQLDAMLKRLQEVRSNATKKFDVFMTHTVRALSAMSNEISDVVAEKFSIEWDLDIFDHTLSFQTGLTDILCGLTYNNDLDLICVAGRKEIAVFDHENGKMAARVQNAHENYIARLHYDSLMRLLFSCGDDGLLKAWKFEIFDKKLALKNVSYVQMKFPIYDFNVISHDQTVLIVGQAADVYTWKINSPQAENLTQVDPDMNLNQKMKAVCFLNGHNAVACTNGSIVLFFTTEGEFIKEVSLGEENGFVWQLLFDAHRDCLIANGTFITIIDVSDLERAKIFKQVVNPSSAFGLLSTPQNERFLTFRADEDLKLRVHEWDYPTLQCRQREKCISVKRVGAIMHFQDASELAMRHIIIIDKETPKVLVFKALT